MSWLARSIANSLGIDDEEEIEEEEDHRRQFNEQSGEIIRENRSSGSKHDEARVYRGDGEGEEDAEGDHSRGVKEDLSEFKQTLTRQILGVANFLAPPPPLPPSSNSIPRSLDLPRDQPSVLDCGRSESCDMSLSGDDNELSLPGPISRLSGKPTEVGQVVVEEISRISSDPAVLLDFRYGSICHQSVSKGEERDWVSEAVGLTDEVLAFAGNIAHHPETWLDFPVEEDDDVDGFNISKCQKEHAMAIEHLIPRLRALRIEFCPIHMSVGYFWKVYFVLLHSRLNKHDADLLSTSEVVEARAKWMKELQKRNREDLERHLHKERAYLQHDDNPNSPQIWGLEKMPQHHWTSASEYACSSSTGDSENEKHPALSTDAQFVDNSVVEEEKLVNTTLDKNSSAGPSPKAAPLHNFGDGDGDEDEDDDDDVWPEDDFSQHEKDLISIPVGIEEDVSFSDLEDDDCSLHIKYKIGSKD